MSRASLRTGALIDWVTRSSGRTGALLLLAVLPVTLYAVQGLALRDHVVLSFGLMAVGLGVSRALPKHRLVVGLLSVAASARYVYWRGTETLILDATMDAVVSCALYGAEIFGFLLLITGYFQTAFRSGRVPAPLAEDSDGLPWVEVFVPTYNEDVGILRRTLVGAVAMDYPRKRVWLLDEQRRPEMRALTEELGCLYMTRPDNRGAKAGNLNHALARTTGGLIAVFDADQVPVRSFLRLTVGQFLANPRLALVQTPHHFYNPDPFERNLHLEGVIPPEQLMFYHVIQVGNDFWNSAFFCGSSAVLRRSALEDVGGIATETVTEDAHTALRMHARGWDSAYLALPQAAGLATERFAFYVSQRMRWARGMIQILLLDNPLLKRGLTWAQRLNYLSAAGHFLFGLPRMVYLLAPPAYLVFGVHPLQASALTIAAYALPHVFLSVIGGSTVSRTARHSFWAEVYETAIAPYIAMVTIVTLLAPRRGKFNVTAKGTSMETYSFDWRSALPNLAVGALIAAGVLATPFRLYLHPVDAGTTLLAAFWNAYNLVLLLAALLVALDRPQRRGVYRVSRTGRVTVTARGATWHGRVVDLAEGGIRMRLPAGSGSAVPEGAIHLSLQSDAGAAVEVPAFVLPADGPPPGDGAAPREAGAAIVRAQFRDLSPSQSRGLIELMFVAANSWICPSPAPDEPLRSAMEVLEAPWVALARRLGSRR